MCSCSACKYEVIVNNIKSLTDVEFKCECGYKKVFRTLEECLLFIEEKNEQRIENKKFNALLNYITQQT